MAVMLPSIGRTVRIRKARVNDVAQIVSLARDLDKTKKKWRVNRRRSFTLQMRHILRGANGHYCWVAINDMKEIVGFAFASNTYSAIDDGMWIVLSDLYIAPKYQGFGIGQRIMKALKRASRKLKTNGFWLMTHQANKGAQRLYRRQGMKYKHMRSFSWVA